MPSTNWHFELGQTKLDHSFFPVNISIGECCQQQEEQFWTFPRLKNHSNVKIKLALIIFSFDTETELLLLRQIPYHLLL